MRYVEDIKEEKDRQYVLVRSDEVGASKMQFIGVYIRRKVYPLCLFCKKIMWHGQ